jgi:hypothetical protein
MKNEILKMVTLGLLRDHVINNIGPKCFELLGYILLA